MRTILLLLLLFASIFSDTGPATAQNTPPMADAGEDQNAWVNEYIVLLGSASDPNNHPIVGWLWNVEISPLGSSPYISEPDTPDPLFQADMAGDYILSLRASDGAAWSEPDSVTIHVILYHSPVAVAIAEPASGPAPLAVQFDGSGSYSADGSPLLYDWVFGDDDSSPSNEVSPSHTYVWPGTYTVILRVQDELGRVSELAIVEITVTSGVPAKPTTWGRIKALYR